MTNEPATTQLGVPERDNPTDRVKPPVIAFDIDGTLIDDDDQPRWEIVGLLRTFHKLGCRIVVWSGGGLDYAQVWGKRLFLPPGIVYLSKFHAEGFDKPALTFDDETVTLGVLNIQTPLETP